MPPESFILGYLILHSKSVIITISVILETSVTWSLQESGIEFTMHWNILSRVKGMTKRGDCSLRLTKKLWLLHYFDDIHLLDKKSEFISKCRHETKLLISSVK